MRSDIGGMMGPGWMMFGMGLSVFLGLGFLVLIALGIHRRDPLADARLGRLGLRRPIGARPRAASGSATRAVK